MEKVVVAYSGGLDTSYCVKYLQNELNLEVHSVLVNTGGFSSEELKVVEKKAYEMGVVSHTNQNILEDYYQKAIKFMVYGNVLKNNTYPLSVSAERVFQAIEVVEYAKKINAKYIAHGSTGAGNDQVRFDMIFQTLAPNIEIITPIRDLKLSRQEEIEYLEKHGVDYPWSKAKYSINKGIWGTSVGGVETLTSHKPLPEEAYPSQLEKTEPTDIKLHFKKGEIVGINDEFDTSVNTILKIEEIASKYAIGRDIHVGDTIVGIKGRVGFEAAAATVIIKAHHLLEKHVLSKWQQNLKENLGSTYGMLLHDGQYFEPAMRDIEAYLTNSQKTVTGEVFVTLKPYHFSLNGIESKHDLMKSKFGEYGETNKAWTAEDAKGFIKILGTANKIYHSVNSEL
ncbi:argininosuccinate synthase [Lutibacter flavus]|uniref:argininosuccinate synthase n=1 Tax=Lutibacter flavus TaxID=691689 RepID=A0A238Z9X9_9FLAO|nr:argininosuccinate synthase [Lutibacter flavus]SNR79741.1 argininosuccinate synthase [Lutibacter flavus]